MVPVGKVVYIRMQMYTDYDDDDIHQVMTIQGKSTQLVLTHIHMYTELVYTL